MLAHIFATNSTQRMTRTPTVAAVTHTTHRSEVSAGEAAIAQLERDLSAAQSQLSQVEAKAAAAQEDAAEKDKVIK